MDKRSIFGFVLIGLIVAAWMMYNTTQQAPPPQKKMTEAELEATAGEAPEITAPKVSQSNTLLEQYGEIFFDWAQRSKSSPTTIITINNGLAEAQFSSRGGVLHRWTLQTYKTWYGAPSQLVRFDNEKGELGINFTSTEAKSIDTRDFTFDLLVNGEEPTATNYNLAPGDSLVLTAKASLETGATITKTFVLYGDSYYFKANLDMVGFEDIIANRRYYFGWENGLQYQDRNSVEESNSGKAVVSLAGSIAEVDAADIDKPVSTRESGKIDFAAIKTKYFGAALIPNIEREEYDVIAEGRRFAAKNNGAVEEYSILFRLPYKTSRVQESFTVFVGPLEYDLLKLYGLSELVDFGWGFIRYIGEYALMPFFNLVHLFIPNFGFAIIVFSIFIKILLYPLSVPQIKSAEKMKLLQPEIKKIQDKHKDDAMTIQKETMALYSKYGINPAGGCLPLLLQFPILIALWSLFNSSIQLRQQPFFGWITDLSAPDIMFTLPFSLPFLGNEVAGLAIFMGATMFIQQKMTITDPRQQAIVYVMPPMMILLFAHFPSGLNLYYFMFNLLSIAQQLWIGKYSKNKVTLESLKKNPAKEGWLQKKMREAQEIAEAQGRSLPGQPPRSSSKSNRNKKK